MDVDVCLSGLLDLYPQEEIVKAGKLREALMARPSSSLFQNGKFLAEIVNLTVSQSRSMIPLGGYGSSPVDYLSGKETIEGKFTLRLADLTHAFSPEFNYDIITMMVMSDGTVSKMTISGVHMSDSDFQDDRLEFSYQALSTNYSTGVTDPWM